MIQAPGGPGEDGDYPHGGWAVPHADPAVGEAIVAAPRRGFRPAAGPPDLRYLRRLLAEGRKKSDGRQSERGDEIRRDPQAGQLGMGAGRSTWTGHHRGRSPRKEEGRSGPDPLGKFDADTGAARTRSCGRGLAARLSNSVWVPGNVSFRMARRRANSSSLPRRLRPPAWSSAPTRPPDPCGPTPRRREPTPEYRRNPCILFEQGRPGAPSSPRSYRGRVGCRFVSFGRRNTDRQFNARPTRITTCSWDIRLAAVQERE